MQKLFKFNGLLLGIALAAFCFIRLEKPRLLKTGFLKANVSKPGIRDVRVTSGAVPKPAGNVLLVQNGSKSSVPISEQLEYHEKCKVLQEKIRQLENICLECRLLIDKSQIEDSVYDPYDNPEGRLNRYQVDMALRRFFNASGALRVTRKQYEELKMWNGGK